jgi:signal transduction histidine kinase
VRIQQVLSNLISNALKYTHKGGHVTIAAHTLERDDVPDTQRNGLSRQRRYVAIAIADTGIGIAPDDHERIFERFYRVESDLKVEAGGTGLGLAIVKPLVHLMGGRLWLDSTPAKGSTFTLLLPTA